MTDTTHIQIVCERCGSTNVLRDACAKWDTDLQDWVLAGVQDHTDCGDCEAEMCAVEKPLP